MIQRKSQRSMSPLVESIFATGHFADVGAVQYHSLDPKHAVLELIEQECKREIADMQKSFPSRTSYALLYLRYALVPLVRARHDFNRAISMAISLIHDLSNDPA